MNAALIYYVAASLDGYIARPDGRVDWLKPIEEAGDDHGYQAFYDSIDGLLMGRVTYETILAFGGAWPYSGKPCTVLTRGDPPRAAAEVQISHDTPAQAIDQLAAAGCRRIWLVGGGSLAGTCYSAGLLDELVVSFIPHLLGAGIPMFATGLERRLQLREQRSFPTGVVQLHYQLLPDTETA
ncbi:dihydrofolate reductase family protein [Pseudomonas sp. BN102]|uniref:dihydrofolate reductase family protein n=1 Tax=Pseudomonas sp. BN102 TaxID=2567886 RepID=UPI0024566448|nr:dihydrofolate reductase family protein [Pseudomonas sp. BN102]MDH4609878.1 dihydrofolate reductase [Pseudomonas sp. BN102]